MRQPGRKPAQQGGAAMAIGDIEAKRIDGTPVRLDAYTGKALLVVNVASRCGFTPQYAGLEQLHQTYGPRGLAVLGFPCNQFGGQEPGTEAEIAGFCDTKYGVTFDLFAKVEVNGPNAHPLYRLLKAEAPGVLGTEAIKWNFTKFLVDPAGKVVKRYGPQTTPKAIAPDIEAVLPKG
jgi:glutathione peroxidase